MRPRANLISASCFLMAALVLVYLGFNSPNSHRSINFVAAGLFLFNSVVQFFLYYKKRPA